MEHWYRVEETTYGAGADEWGDPLPGGPTKTNLTMCRVLKRTPTGAWVEGRYGPKFVNLSWGKRYALPTVDEAIASFKARKRRQIQLANSTIRRAEESLRYLDERGFYSDAREWMEVDTDVQA